MRKAIFALVVLCPIASTAQSPPLECKGVRLGQTQAEAIETVGPSGISCHLNMFCTLVSPTPSDLVTFGGAPAEIRFDVTDGKVSDCSVTLDTVFYRSVREALIKKYGKPTSTKKAKLLVSGTEYQNEISEWIRKDGVLLMYKHRSSDPRSWVNFGPPYASDGLIKEEVKKRAKDL